MSKNNSSSKVQSKPSSKKLSYNGSGGLKLNYSNATEYKRAVFQSMKEIAQSSYDKKRVAR